MLVQCRMPETAPFLLLKPVRQTAPMVLTSPHSGRRYDPAFLAASRLDALSIRRSEDSFVDELFGAGPNLGVPLLAAQFPRAYCDVNREAWELDPAMFADELPAYVNTRSPRVQAGLGTIARIVGTGEPIYAGKLRFAEAEARINGCWQPFHDQLNELTNETLAEFGACLILDCHSMPSLPGRHGARPDIILGDGHGTSSAPGWTDFIQARFEAMGLTVHRNEPYAGGYITRHYGRPREGVQAVQVEVARGLYMNERNFTRGPQFPETQRLISRFLAALIEASRVWGAAGPQSRAAAAE
jgi:N-formylglutamate deformylase